MRKRAQITVEIERLLVLGRSSFPARRWCIHCKAYVQTIGVNEATIIAGVGQRRLFRLADSGEIHCMETNEGQALFCVNSLLKLRKENS